MYIQSQFFGISCFGCAKKSEQKEHRFARKSDCILSTIEHSMIAASSYFKAEAWIGLWGTRAPIGAKGKDKI